MNNSCMTACNTREFGRVVGVVCGKFKAIALVVAMVVVLAGYGRAEAQCPAGWPPFDTSISPYPGVTGDVFNTAVYASTYWDPDGPGPLTPRLVIGGVFAFAGNVQANSIAAYDPGTGQWSPLGTGLAGGNSIPTVYALTTLPNGDLIAAGDFSTAGGVPANNIARWNGSAWSRLGTGIDSFVYALATLPKGDLIAGGSFSTAGGASAYNIARWNGSAWSPLGTGLTDSVFSLTTLPNGDLIAGGRFQSAGLLLLNSIARWNGSTWSALGGGLYDIVDGNSRVSTLATLPNGDLIAGGTFIMAGGVSVKNIARWNGSTWSAIGVVPNFNRFNSNRIHSIAPLPNGDIIVGGDFTTIGGVPAVKIARWNGSAWSALGAGINDPDLFSTSIRVRTLATLPTGDLFVGGSFSRAGGATAMNIARYTFGTPAPTIATHPVPQSACVAGSAAFAVTPAGTGPFTYQWRKGAVAINATTNPSAATGTLTLVNVQAGDAGSYDCVVSTPCGSVTSNAVSFTLAVCACGLSDVAGPGQSIGSDSTLTADDIIVYLNWFFAGDTRADVAGPGQSSVPDSQFTADDIIVFLNRFFAGC